MKLRATLTSAAALLTLAAPTAPVALRHAVAVRELNSCTAPSRQVGLLAGSP
jgi:hypothetical protein